VSADSILSTIQALLAVGGGGLGLAAVGKVLVKAFRGESRKGGSPTPAPPASMRPTALPGHYRMQHVSYPDMDQIERMRAELLARIEASEDACNETRRELAELQQKHYQVFDAKVSEIAKEVHTLAGEFRAGSPSRRRQ
jgi:hypothetical protein